MPMTGMQREADCSTAARSLRITKGIPSPKPEPINLWLTKAGCVLMHKLADPALALNQARQTRYPHCRSDKWFRQITESSLRRVLRRSLQERPSSSGRGRNQASGCPPARPLRMSVTPSTKTA